MGMEKPWSAWPWSNMDMGIDCNGTFVGGRARYPFKYILRLFYPLGKKRDVSIYHHSTLL